MYANIPIGNEQAFAIQGQQYNYTPGGTLVPGDYKVESVKRYFISSVLYSENYSGTMDASLQIFTNKLMLNHINFVEDFEIEPFSVTVTGTLAKTNRDKFSGAYSLETTNRAHSSDSSGYITFQALAGRTISFRYRVSSQASVDKLYIYLNDVVLVNGIAGEGQWSQATGISKNGENIIRVRYVKNAAASYYLDAGFIDDIVIPINYENYGEYVSLPIDISLFPSSLKITWSAETSDETFAIVSTAVSDSSEVSPDGSLFVEQVSGQIITNLPIGSFQGKYLWIKISLSTNNELISPIMHRLILEDALENDDTILLTMDPFKRFHNVVGDLTVNYDATKGNLMGVGGLVDSFSISFTPTDLMVKTNPYIFEHIEVSASATGIRRAVFYTSGQASDEHIEVSNISAQGVLIHIDDL